MPTELDLRLNAGMAALTAPDGQLPVASIERFGTRLPIIAAAPPSLAHYFAHFCHQHADMTMLVAGSERLTFAQTYGQAQQVARALVARGVKRGDRVGIAMRNSPSWIALYMGILMAGGTATLLNGWWKRAELERAIEDVGCSLVFADPPRATLLEGAANVVAIDDLLPLVTALAPVTAGDDAEAALPELGPDDDATILFTSGSTGRSKGAVSDHRAVLQGTFNFLANALAALGVAIQDGYVLSGQPAMLMNLPMFHVTGEVPMLLQSMAMGRKLVLMPKWDAEEAMRLIEAERVTYFIGVPLMSYEMMTHPNKAKYDLSSVTDYSAGGAPRPPEHVRRMAEEMGGGQPLTGYGLTETNAIGSVNLRDSYLGKPASAGRMSKPLVEIAILDDAGEHLPTGTRGEIAIRSAANFKGYWNAPEATAAAIMPDGFFRTGDVGYLDEDGYLFIVDRKKDIIIRGGENISCIEVEGALYENPAVAEAAVFGLPDAHYGELPGAVVHLHEDAEAMTGEELRGFLLQHISAFKVPVRIWVSAVALPRLGTEKIDKVALRTQYRAIAAAEAA